MIAFDTSNRYVVLDGYHMIALRGKTLQPKAVGPGIELTTAAPLDRHVHGVLAWSLTACWASNKIQPP